HTKKQKKEFEKDLNKVQNLTDTLNKALTKLQNLPTSDKEIKTLGKQIDKMAGKLDQLNKNLLRMEPGLKELQQLRDVLKDIKHALPNEPSSELKKIANKIQSQRSKTG
ncbi:MAG TPA: hypothetical protein VGZ69_04415, partial [Candidatus Rhabdochlamydia sp.]|nr:hypothetical protein [Candidatus Rhabdochlamydia sp.]